MVCLCCSCCRWRDLATFFYCTSWYTRTQQGPPATTSSTIFQAQQAATRAWVVDNRAGLEGTSKATTLIFTVLILPQAGLQLNWTSTSWILLFKI